MTETKTRLVLTERGEKVKRGAAIAAGALAVGVAAGGAGVGLNVAHEALKAPTKKVLEWGIENGVVADPYATTSEHDSLGLDPNPPKIDSLPVPEQTSIPVPMQPEQND